MLLPVEVSELQAEVARLQQALEQALDEKDRALRSVHSQNTALQGRVWTQTRQLDTLKRLVTTMSASLDLQVVAQSALRGFETLLEVQGASLALLDGSGEIRFVMATPAERLPLLAGLRMRVGQGILGKVIETGRPQVVTDALVDPAHYTGVDRVTGLKTRSVLCQPLMIHDRVIGAVELINKRAGPFSDSDRAFVETVAGSLAIAIENARMYEEVRARLRELEDSNRTLRETQNQLVQSEKLASIGQLTAGLAHEINTPIGVILGLAQLLDRRADDSLAVQEYAALIEQEAMRIKRIVSDLLAFARHTAPEIQRHDLREILNRALALVEYQLADENVAVTREYAPEPSWVMVDSDQITQVLMNLIQNARQAMPHGGQLTLSTGSDRSVHLFTVSDTGAGIPESDLDRIFDPFFTTKQVGQGTGLGLSVSYGIVARHGGEIRVASRPGAGTTFTVRLPAAADAPQGAPLPRNLLAQPTQSG